MKRLILMALMFCLLLGAACAESLPKAVQSLCDDAYPGYAVLAMDGYDDGTTGQWAVVLTKNGDNALVIAERTGGGAYALTVNNPNAMPDEGEGYSRETHTVSVKLSKQDETHDRLGEFEMSIEQPGTMCWVITGELQDDGRTWGNVISQYTSMDGAENIVWWSHMFAEDGTISYMRHRETPEGTPKSTDSYPRVPVAGEAMKAHLLDEFDAGLYPYMPDLMNGRQITDYAGGYVPDGCVLVQLDLQEKALILLTESPQGERTLRILPHENWQFGEAVVTGPLPESASLDLFHADEGELQLAWFDGENVIEIAFAQTALNIWAPVWMMTGEGVLEFTYNSVALWEEAVPLRNDAMHYGNHPWHQIGYIDFDALPKTLKEALAVMNQNGYAVVNNPNPEDRLHLRELPQRDARSLGKFYNRTPVQVHRIEGDWALVNIGSISGWMMTRYLAFGEDMDGVACAFPQMFLKEGVEKVALRPYREGKTPGMIDRETSFYIVGVEEDRYVILTEDGITGYLNQSYFYSGNG